jgi:chemosensory pili system protein ChpC
MNPSSTDELYALLVPLANERLLVPRASVAEVITWQDPDKMVNAPLWYLGTVSWNGRIVPVISFEGVCGHEMPPPGGRTRIVIFVAVSGALTGGYFAIVTQGFPQLVRANPDVIKPDPEHHFAEQSPVLCQVRMINETPLIPDFEYLEKLVAQETSV